MTLNSFNVLNVGVGGQGVISATMILAHAAMLENYNVRTAETHGMAQRGGSVTGYLRFGTEVQGSLIPQGGAQLIMSLEPIEAFRNRHYANKNTIFFINQNKITPLSIYQNRKLKYPTTEEIKAELAQITKNVYFINANQLAVQAGNVKAVNVVMIGFLMGSGKLPLDLDKIKLAILKYVPAKARKVNEHAFDLGYQEGQKIMEALKNDE